MVNPKIKPIIFVASKDGEALYSEQKQDLESTVAQITVSDYLPPHGLYPARFLCPWTSPGKNTGMSILQGLNLGLLHCKQILYI